MTKEEVMKLVADSSTHRSEFTAEKKQASMNVWIDRRTKAIAYHKRVDLQKKAEDILQFIKDRDPNDLQLCTSGNSRNHTVFLFDKRTTDYFIMGEKCQSSTEGDGVENLAKPALMFGQSTGDKPCSKAAVIAGR